MQESECGTLISWFRNLRRRLFTMQRWGRSRSNIFSEVCIKSSRGRSRILKDRVLTPVEQEWGRRGYMEAQTIYHVHGPGTLYMTFLQGSTKSYVHTSLYATALWIVNLHARPGHWHETSLVIIIIGWYRKWVDQLKPSWL